MIDIGARELGSATLHSYFPLSLRCLGTSFFPSVYLDRTFRRFPAKDIHEERFICEWTCEARNLRPFELTTLTASIGATGQVLHTHINSEDTSADPVCVLRGRRRGRRRQAGRERTGALLVARALVDLVEQFHERLAVSLRESRQQAAS